MTAPVVAATVVSCDASDAGSETLCLQLAEPFAAITPGQSAVVFQGTGVLGGGRIVRAFRAASGT